LLHQGDEYCILFQINICDPLKDATNHRLSSPFIHNQGSLY
jgi:hypothetical protein